MNDDPTGARTSKNLTLDDVLLRLSERFTSGNIIPVERAHLTRDEGAVLMTAIAELRKSAPQPMTQARSSNETKERSLPELLRRLDALTDLPVGVTAIADETIFRDAAAEIRSLERRLETANARIQRWQMPECTDPGWEMRDGQMACKGCNRSFSDIFNSAEARCRRRSPEKAGDES